MWLRLVTRTILLTLVMVQLFAPDGLPPTPVASGPSATQGHSVFVEALHDRFPKALKGCVRGGALLPRHPPREPQPSPKVEPDDNISASAQCSVRDAP